jgi:hypothetical protein
VLVRNILEHPDGFSWKMQDIGLLSLRLTEDRAYRLHVWDPDRFVGPPVIHDHPYDFVSRIIVGEMTNIRYTEDPSGDKYVRELYSMGNEDERHVDYVQLVGQREAYGEGGEYAQKADELHDSRQLPGTVTLLRCTFLDKSELTVCRSEDAPWVTGLSREATANEVKEIAALALAWF